jgi:hypothetical protein
MNFRLYGALRAVAICRNAYRTFNASHLDNVAICFDASNQNAQFLPKLAAAGLAQRVNGSPASVILNIENPP